MNLALNTFTYAAGDPVKIVADALAVGFDGVGLFSRHADALRRIGWRSAPVVGEYVEFLQPGAQPESVANRLEAAGAIGAGCLVLVPTAQWRLLNAWRSRLSDTLARLGEAAEGIGVSFAIEPLHPKRSDLTCITQPSEALAIVRALPARDFGWILDLAHVTDLSEALALPGAVERLRSVHLADCRDPAEPDDRCLPGDGSIPVGAAMSALRLAGYEGWYEVELQGREAASQPQADHMRRSLERARRLLGEAV